MAYFEHDAEGAVVVAGAGDAERPDLCCGGYVLTNAGADVVVADVDKAESLAGILGQFVQLYAFGNLVAGHEDVTDGEVLGDEFVHLAFNLCHLAGGGTGGQEEVDLGLLTFDMCILGALTAKHPYHGLVQQMFGGVAGTMLVLVVLVQDGCLFHVVTCLRLVLEVVVVEFLSALGAEYFVAIDDVAAIVAVVGAAGVSGVGGIGLIIFHNFNSCIAVVGLLGKILQVVGGEYMAEKAEGDGLVLECAGGVEDVAVVLQRGIGQHLRKLAAEDVTQYLAYGSHFLGLGLYFVVDGFCKLVLVCLFVGVGEGCSSDCDDKGCDEYL